MYYEHNSMQILKWNMFDPAPISEGLLNYFVNAMLICCMYIVFVYFTPHSYKFGINVKNPGSLTITTALYHSYVLM